jgi:hypothetical protein
MVQRISWPLRRDTDASQDQQRRQPAGSEANQGVALRCPPSPARVQGNCRSGSATFTTKIARHDLAQRLVSQFLAPRGIGLPRHYPGFRFASINLSTSGPQISTPRPQKPCPSSSLEPKAGSILVSTELPALRPPHSKLGWVLSRSRSQLEKENRNFCLACGGSKTFAQIR